MITIVSSLRRLCKETPARVLTQAVPHKGRLEGCFFFLSLRRGEPRNPVSHLTTHTKKKIYAEMYKSGLCDDDDKAIKTNPDVAPLVKQA